MVSQPLSDEVSWLQNPIVGDGPHVFKVRKSAHLRGTRPQRGREGVRCFSVEPGETGLTALEGTGDGIDQHAKGGWALLTAGLAQR